MPGSVLKMFASRGAFIFVLEAMAQILALFAFRRELSDAYMSFVDNTAAQCALRKGYSSDETMNILASVFWATEAENGSTPWFERVSSTRKIVGCGLAFGHNVDFLCEANRASWPQGLV